MDCTETLLLPPHRWNVHGGRRRQTSRHAPRGAEPGTGSQTRLISEIRKEQNGHVTRNGTIYSFDPLETANWLAIVSQPEPIAYEPVHDLLRKITVPAGWLIAGTAIAAWLAGRF